MAGRGLAEDDRRALEKLRPPFIQQGIFDVFFACDSLRPPCGVSAALRWPLSISNTRRALYSALNLRRLTIA
jgi:hypothetical protein